MKRNVAFFLGIDGGGTTTKACVTDVTGKILGEGTGGPSNLYYTPESELLNSVRRAISLAIHAAGEKCAALKEEGLSKISFACVALAGAGRESDILKAESLLKPLFGSTPFLVTEDSKAALKGACGGNDGIVIISGTGSNCLGVRDGVYRRAGGWGSLLGDEGSAYSIAKRGLTAALRAYDGRGPQTSLTERFVSYLGGKRPEELLPLVHRLDRPTIASLSIVVFEESDKNDRVARKILKEEALELVIMVQAVARALGFCDKVPVAMVGSCFKHPGFRGFFESSLLTRLPGASVSFPLHPPCVGAAMIAGDEFSARIEPNDKER